MNDYGNIYDYECLWLWWLSWLFKGFMIYHMNDYEWLWWYIYGTKKGIKGTPMIYVPYNYHIR